MRILAERGSGVVWWWDKRKDLLYKYKERMKNITFGIVGLARKKNLNSIINIIRSPHISSMTFYITSWIKTSDKGLQDEARWPIRHPYRF